MTDVHFTPGNVHDSLPYLSRLDRQVQRFGFKVEAVALDSGYLNKVKVVTRHVWEEHKEKVRLNRLSKSEKMLYKFRKEKN